VAKTRQLASFFVGELCFGVDVLTVQEVRAPATLTPVPRAARIVAGLLNLRGQIVPAIDVRRCLDLADAPAGQLPMNLIVRTDDGCVSLLVDRVGEVHGVSDDDFELPPQTVRGRSRKVIRGAYKLEGGLLLALDIHKILMGLAHTEPTRVFAEV
jgi:purine-binding chemotaxis protein CheW